MLKILWLSLFCLFKLITLGQDNCKQSLAEILSSAKDNTCIAVEGYYVDNSSFMVTNSSDPIIRVNTRYPVYEYKYQENPYSKINNQMAEVPIFIKREMQGENHQRILFLNKKQTTKNQLILNEGFILGINIIEDKAEYIQAVENRIYLTPLYALRDFLFNQGPMPQIDEETTPFTAKRKSYMSL
ncbi:hypothetical protein CLV62_111120 [Dysgonomonas alginatilytica]|uniref:Uncharacterized protein n=1 Tax=Dysgonomonas alginatilytica TaxID=1605892 RepID=A0A2V3PNJ5_9BACT|nr:hypothetical protein [Dysgonomonas alginatilytica]PXV64162.1 hypothetical protein CLV62_111120 [Dysgonomonas alginatilytica]